MRSRSTHTAVAAVVIGLHGLVAIESAGAQSQAADLAAGPDRSLVAEAIGPVVRKAPTPQIQYDDRLQATFGIAADEHGATVLSIESATLQVRKTILADQTVLVLTARDHDRVEVSVRRGAIGVSRGRRSVALSLPLAAGDLDRVQGLLLGSSAVRAFRALVRAGEATRTESFFDGFLTSDALLGVLHGDPHATDALRSRIRARGGARLRPAAWQWSTKDCWDSYSGQAIAVYDEYTDCTSDLSWYDVLGKATCEAIYVVEAEMAFSWLVACNGGFFAQ
jgi:hypothetical protein